MQLKTEKLNFAATAKRMQETIPEITKWETKNKMILKYIKLSTTVLSQLKKQKATLSSKLMKKYVKNDYITYMLHVSQETS